MVTRKLKKFATLFTAVIMTFSQVLPSATVLNVQAATTIDDKLTHKAPSYRADDTRVINLAGGIIKDCVVVKANGLHKYTGSGAEKDWVNANKDSHDALTNHMQIVNIADVTDSDEFIVDYVLTSGANQYTVRLTVHDFKGKISGCSDGYFLGIYEESLCAIRYSGYKSVQVDMEITSVVSSGVEISADSSIFMYNIRDLDSKQGVAFRNLDSVTSIITKKAADGGMLKVAADHDNGLRSEKANDSDDNTVNKNIMAQVLMTGKKSLKITYLSGGADPAGGAYQTNGVYFDLDTGTGIIEPEPPNIEKTVNGNKSYDLKDESEEFTYALTTNIADWVKGMTTFGIDDQMDKAVNYKEGSLQVTCNGADVTGNFYRDTGSGTGNHLVVRATDGYLATNPSGRFVFSWAATLNTDVNLRDYIPAGGNNAQVNNQGYVLLDDGRVISDIATITSPFAELSIDKITTTPDNKYEFKVGDAVNYKITVTNKTAGATAYDTTLDDIIPSYLKPNSASSTLGSVGISGQSLTGDLGNISGGASAAIIVNCTALESGNTKEFKNDAHANCRNSIIDGGVYDDAETYINSADLWIDTYNDKYEYEIGETAKHTVIVKNNTGFADNVTITEDATSGMKIDYDSIKIEGVPSIVNHPDAGTADPTNQLNPELLGETRQIANKPVATKTTNGFTIPIKSLPAGAVATITFNAEATKDGNGKESQPTATASASNADTVKDDSEFYVNTATLTLKKDYTNPYLSKKDNRADNEFRVYEEETGYEQVHYNLEIKNTESGTVAKNVVINDITLPDGLVLNYGDIEIKETSRTGRVTTFSKASGGNGDTFNYLIAGTIDVPDELNPAKYYETESRTPVIKIEKSGNGFIIKDSYLQGGAKLNITYTANALEEDGKDVNGTEVTNTATATADNLEKDSEGKNVIITDDTTVYINSPRLKIVKEADSDNYSVGDNVSYTISVINEKIGTIARNLVFTDTLETEGAEFLTGTIALYDTNGYELREGAALGSTVDYNKKAKTTEFTLTSNKHLVVDGNYSKYDLAKGENPKEQGTWNPPYNGVTSETAMTIKYDMKITDKELAGEDIKNTATAVSDEALKVITDETIIPEDVELVPKKTVDKDSFTVGEDATFTIDIENTTQYVVAKNIQITDRLNKSGMVTIKEDSMKVTFNNKDITKQCEITYNDSKDGFDMITHQDIKVGDNIRVIYKATTSLDAVGEDLINGGNTWCDNNPDYKAFEVPLTVIDPDPDLVIEKKSDKKIYSVGDTGHYELTVTQKADNAIARNVVISDGLDRKDAKILVNTLKIYDKEKNDITDGCEIEKNENAFEIKTNRDLAQNQYFTVKYDVSFLEESLAGQDVTNVAKTHADNAPEETVDNVVQIITPDLEIAKTSDKKVYEFKGTAHYTVTVSQEKENATAYNVVINDDFHIPGVKILKDTIKIANTKGKDITSDCKITATDGSYKIITNKDLEYEEKFTVTYDVKFIDSSLIDKVIPNVAEAVADNASASADNEVMPVEVVTEGGEKYEILKSCTPISGSIVNVGDEIQYDITIKNTGDKVVKNLLIRDAIPVHTKYVSGGDLRLIEGKQYVLFVESTLAKGKSITKSFKVKVVDEGLCQIVNSGEVKTYNTSVDLGGETTESTETTETTESTETTETTETTESTETTETTESTEAVDEDDDSSWSILDHLIDFIGGIVGTITGNDTETGETDIITENIPEVPTTSPFIDNDFVFTNQVVHTVPYTVTVIAPELEIEKKADKEVYVIGETGHYTVTVKQIKENTVANDVIIKDELENKDAAIVENSIKVFNDSNKEITDKCEITQDATSYNIVTKSTLAQDEIIKVTYDVIFEKGSLAGTQVKNVAKATASNLPEDDTWVEDDEIVTVDKPVLTIKKTSNENTYKVGETGKYKLVVKNITPGSTANNVVINDTFDNDDAKLVKDSITIKDDDGKKVSKAEIEYGDSSFVIKTNSDLAGEKSFIVTYKVKFTKKGSYKNTAKASSDNTDPVEDDKTVKVNKIGVTTPKQAVSNIISGNVKTGDVFILVICAILFGGMTYFGFIIRKRIHKK